MSDGSVTWGVAGKQPLPAGPGIAAAAALVCSAGIVGWLVSLPLGYAAGTAAGAAWAALAIVWATGQGRRALAALGARPADPDEHARLINIVRGLGERYGGATPKAMVIPGGEANALVGRSGGAPVVAVTSSLLDTLPRTELEAVVAHCLARSDPSLTTRASVACSLGPLLFGLAPKVGYDDDVRAAALTRYPPALASALRKTVPRAGRFAPLWMAAQAPTHRPLVERIAALEDL
jgi:Zn-dependent protease with chaperone function